MFLFDRRKYVVLIAGLLMLGIGFALMMGGGAESPDEFNPEIFGTQRIGIAPWFIHWIGASHCGHNDEEKRSVIAYIP